jgi:hypothetical protein
MRLIILFLTLLFTFSAFANLPQLNQYTQLKPIGNNPRFAPYPFTNKATSRFGATVTNNGRFAVATFKTNSPSTLAKQLLRKNPWAIAGLTALAFFQDEDNQWYKSQGETPQNLLVPMLEQSKVLYDCKDNNIVHASIEFDANTSSEVIDQRCSSASVSPVKSSLSALSQEPCTTNSATTDYQFNSHGVLFTYQKWDNFNRICQPRETFINIQPFFVKSLISKECPDSHPIPYWDDVAFCVNQSTRDQFAPLLASTQQMSTALSDSMTDDPYSGWDWKPFSERENDPFLSPDSVDAVNEPQVSDQFNDYLKSVASGNYQTSSPESPDYVPAEFVKPTQAAIKATEDGQPLIDPTTDEIIEPDVTTPDPTPVTTPNPNTPYEITVNIPEDDTISQTEYEQSNQMFFDDFQSAADPSTQQVDTLLQTAKDGDESFIDSLNPDVLDADIPALPIIADLWPTASTGQCIPFSLDVSLQGKPKKITFDKHCPPYNLYVNPMLTYFLYIITGLYVLHLAGRTFTRTVS